MTTLARTHRSEPLLALLVDRDDDTRRMYAEFLRLGAWEIEEASDGREALAKAISHPPSVIVTETRLPGISGLDLCALLRRDSTTASIPIVIVTGDAFTSDVQKAEASGADLVLVKPCLPERLAEEIQKVLEQSRELRLRSALARERLAEHLNRAEVAMERSRTVARKYNLKHAHKRGDTTTPPSPPPSLLCPQCDRVLAYKRSHIGGVSERHPEQWDYFECDAGCGTFQYRLRTRKLRRVS
jgi:two-component system, cell cycle response regulator DivK